MLRSKVLDPENSFRILRLGFEFMQNLASKVYNCSKLKSVPLPLVFKRSKTAGLELGCMDILQQYLV